MEKESDLKSLEIYSENQYQEAFESISSYTSNEGFDIYKLESTIPKGLLNGLSEMVDTISSENITYDTSDQQLDDFTDRVFRKILEEGLPQREVLNVVLVSKILHNLEYSNRNITPLHIKNVLYRKNETSDLMWVWLDIYRKKLMGIQRDI